MKISALNELGLLKKTMDDIDVDLGTVITNDEFKRPYAGDRRTRSYRETAVERLVKTKEPFHSNCNIIHSMMVAFVKVSCPYCKETMGVDNGSGNGSTSSVHYLCPKCGADVHLSLPNDGFSCVPHVVPETPY